MLLKNKVAFFWFRRDLRIEDNAGLYHALRSTLPVIPLFIFDTDILNVLDHPLDHRVEFIHSSLQKLNQKLLKWGSSLLVKHGVPLEVWKQLSEQFDISEVYTNHDYEPYAIERDKKIGQFLNNQGIPFHTFKDQVIFEKNEIIKDDGKNYTVFTPYSKKWKNSLSPFNLCSYPVLKYINNLYKTTFTPLPRLEEIGFKSTGFSFPSSAINETVFLNYSGQRNYPSVNGTSHLGIHLRFGTISIRSLVSDIKGLSEDFLNELIWREFFMMILYHFPDVVSHSFKREYDNIIWRNNEDEFQRWCEGQTGYPIVDAGMRELNKTGFMHNRVRMITASFLCKHLLIDWRWGEHYFSQKLLDYELASNNGNWQWAAGGGCDAAPYFRIFNPYVQTEKFDKDLKYIHKWVPEFNSSSYPRPIIDHEFARKRALQVYKDGLQSAK